LKPEDKLHSSLRSRGTCERCGKIANCNDVDIHLDNEKMQSIVGWHIASNPIVNTSNTSVRISKKLKDGRVFEIQLCPTVSLSVWLFDETLTKKLGSNHHIYGVLQINGEKDFDELWNAIEEVLEKRGDFKLIEARKK
jgi:hypothetical protein